MKHLKKDTELTFTLLRQKTAVFQKRYSTVAQCKQRKLYVKKFCMQSIAEDLFNRWASEDPHKQGCKGAG